MSERLDRIEKMLEKIATTQAELAISQKQTDAQLAKTDAQLAKTDAQLAKTDAQLAKTDAQLAKTDAQLAKTDSKLRQLGFNIGASVEQLFQIALEKRMTLHGIKYDGIAYNLKKQKGKVHREYDIVLYNGNSVALIEVKHSLKIDDLRKLKDEQLPDFRILFPEYSAYKIYLGAASTHIENSVKEYAANEGISVLTHDAKATELNTQPLIAF